jgi:hypothetical protein
MEAGILEEIACFEKFQVSGYKSSMRDRASTTRT